MKPCFGYVRVSTLKQGEGVSLEAQKEAIERFCLSNDIEITRWFEEKITAAKSGRPQFNAMLKLLRKRKAAGVVMHKIDRSARNFRDWATIGELADNGIDVHFATESLDFRSRGGRLSADIQAVIAADYIRNLKEEVRKGIDGRLKQGLYPFPAPLGYRNNGGGKLKTIDPVKGPLVKKAFELYASGRHSLDTLHEKLDEIGLRNSKGRPVSRAMVSYMLNNPFYAGIIHIRRSGKTWPGKHEPLISMQLFETVLAIKAGKTVMRKTHHQFLFRGLFQCRQCGRFMVGERQKGHVYYRCHDKTCGRNCIREERMEDALLQTLKSAQLSKQAIEVIELGFAEWVSDTDMEGQRRSLTMQLQKIDARQDRLTDALLDRIIDETEFDRRKRQLLLDRKRLEERLQECTETRLDPETLRRTLERLKSLAEYYRFAGREEKREIAEIASSNRTVWQKKACVTPSNWLETACHSTGVQTGPHDRNTPRTDRAKNGESEARDMPQRMSKLAAWANSPETRKLEKISEKHTRKPRSGKTSDYPPNQPRL